MSAGDNGQGMKLLGSKADTAVRKILRKVTGRLCAIGFSLANAPTLLLENSVTEECEGVILRVFVTRTKPSG